MCRFSIVVALLINSFVFAQVRGESPSEKSKTIPLGEIWAYKMPGARDIFDLDKKGKDKPGGGLVGSTLRSSMLRLDEVRPEQLKAKNWARSGFAVSSSGRAALQATHAVFVTGEKPRNSFLPDEEITIVFFSEPAGGNHVRIQQVVRKGERIEIQYRLEPYLESYVSQSLALIPLGRLPIGKYHVEAHQLPREEKFSKWGLKLLDEEWSREALCKSFSFTISNKRE